MAAPRERWRWPRTCPPGAPADDWLFLARFAGAHLGAVLHLVAAVTGTSVDVLRTECEVREAAHLVADLGAAFGDADQLPPRAVTRLAELSDLVLGRRWWVAEGRRPR